MESRHIAVFLVFLFFSGCAAKAPGGGESVSPGIASAPDGSELQQCLDSCRGIMQDRMLENCRIGCHINQAKASRDPAACGPIKAYDNASMFYSSCLGNVAGELGNDTLCGQSRNQSEMDWCILVSADYIKDPSICGPINDSVIKGACIDSAGKSVR